MKHLQAQVLFSSVLFLCWNITMFLGYCCYLSISGIVKI